MALKVFVDSDVVISSLIPSTGAAFLLLNQTTDIELCISNKSKEELEKVVDRLGLSSIELKQLIQTRVTTIHLEKTLKEIKKEFADHVLDIDDAHIVAGAKKAKVNFLISYKTKHFKADKIKDDFNIILTTPSNLLQYLRSI